MIRLENKRTYRGAGVYIGRPSLLGNSFEIGVHGDREDVVRLYRRAPDKDIGGTFDGSTLEPIFDT